MTDAYRTGVCFGAKHGQQETRHEKCANRDTERRPRCYVFDEREFGDVLKKFDKDSILSHTPVDLFTRAHSYLAVYFIHEYRER